MFRQLLLLVIISLWSTASIARPIHHVHHRYTHHRVVASLTGVKGSVLSAPSRHASHAAQPPLYVAHVHVSKPHVLEAQSDEVCLAMAIYHEAKSEGLVGEAGVGYSITNRTANRHFPKTPCGVVYQKGRDKTGALSCQFDFVCHPPSRINQAQMAEAHRVARGVLDRTIPNPIGDALYFNEACLHLRPPRYAPYMKVIRRQAFFSPTPYPNDKLAVVAR